MKRKFCKVTGCVTSTVEVMYPVLAKNQANNKNPQFLPNQADIQTILPTFDKASQKLDQKLWI